MLQCALFKELYARLLKEVKEDFGEEWELHHHVMRRRCVMCNPYDWGYRGVHEAYIDFMCVFNSQRMKYLELLTI